MTAKELINELKKYDKDRVVVLSDGIGWSNIEEVVAVDPSIDCTIRIINERFPVFSDN